MYLHSVIQLLTLIQRTINPLICTTQTAALIYYEAVLLQNIEVGRASP